MTVAGAANKVSWHILALALYSLIAIVAFAPQIVAPLGLAPLSATGILVALLLVLGASHAWMLFVAAQP